MSLQIGNNNISDIYVGNSKISDIYVGNSLIYTANQEEPYYLGFHPNNPSEVCTVKFYQFITTGANWSKFTNPTPVTPVFQYSYNCKTWQTYTFGTTLSIGGGNPGAVYFKGDNLSPWYGTYSDGTTSYATYIYCILNGSVSASGNIMSLRYSNSTDTNNTTIPCASAFFRLFQDCTSLTTPPSLPATTLVERCYYEMFKGCTSLATTPLLPATTLTNYCYSSMFYGCTSLTTPPLLPSTTLAPGCYFDMFYNCASLATAPSLPATTLADSCYWAMFSGCTSLTTPPSLPATTLAASCYCSMFDGCTSLVRIPKLNVLTIPEGGIIGTYSSMYRRSSVRANSTSSGVCNKAYRIPTSGTGTAGSKDLDNMFTDLAGTGSFTPSINTTFYINVPSF